MKLLVTSKVPCKLDRGEARRVPQSPSSWVIAYHVCCPKCGFVTLVLDGRDGLKLSEESGLSFSAWVRCHFCKLLMKAEGGELLVKEDGETRNVRYR